MDITGGVAIVTGAASGLGAATASRLAGLGAHVVVVDIDTNGGLAMADRVGGTFIEADVTDEAAVEAAVAQAADLGPVRVLATIAGGEGTRRRILDHKGRVHPLNEWDRTIALNMTGTFNMLRYAAQTMAATEPLDGGQRGVVVHCASIAGWDGAPGLAAYASAKSGLMGLTLTAARELSQFGIRVNCIVPGVFQTPALDTLQERFPGIPVVATFFPDRVGDPAEFAGMVGHIVDNDYLNAAILRLDGGTRMGHQVV